MGRRKYFMAHQLDPWEVEQLKLQREAERAEEAKKKEEFILEWISACSGPSGLTPGCKLRQAEVLWKHFQKKADLTHNHGSGLY